MNQFTNEQQFIRNKYIFLMKVVSAMLDLNISQNSTLGSMVLMRMAYNCSKGEDQDKIKRVYQTINQQFNQSYFEGQQKMQHFEQITLENYVEELRTKIDNVNEQDLKVRLAVHLNNVIDAFKIHEFFAQYIMAEEARLELQPYFEAINSLTLSQLLGFIDSKIRILYNY